MRQSQCWICGKDHTKNDFLSCHGRRPQNYSGQGVQAVGVVGQSIPQIYVEFDNKQEDHQASIIEMEGKLSHQVVSIFIDPRSNHIYVNVDLMDKCGLRKEVHSESWLVQLAIGTKKIVHHSVRGCAFELNRMPTSMHMNMLLLGS